MRFGWFVPSRNRRARTNRPIVPPVVHQVVQSAARLSVTENERLTASVNSVGPIMAGLSKEAFMHVNKALAVLVLVLFGTIPSAFAQSDTGTIDGRVLDAQKNAVPGVTVTAKNLNTGLTRSTVSSGSGTFHFEALPAGSYDVTAELQGFSKQVHQAVVIQVGQQN